MREEDPADWWKPGYSSRRWLTIGIIAVSLLTSLFYFARTTGIIRRSKRVAPVVARASPIEQHEKGSLRVNINTATIEELEMLPGIGPARARSIAANRPYKSIDDLARVQGLGAKLANGLRPFIKTEGDTEKILVH
jgi:competence ComEA-like helix-hairpin-helix protein